LVSRLPMRSSRHLHPAPPPRRARRNRVKARLRRLPALIRAPTKARWSMDPRRLMVITVRIRRMRLPVASRIAEDRRQTKRTERLTRARLPRAACRLGRRHPRRETRALPRHRPLHRRAAPRPTAQRGESLWFRRGRLPHGQMLPVTRHRLKHRRHHVLWTMSRHAKVKSNALRRVLHQLESVLVQNS
jgi:hypothetical protein